jgi:hypothetical protein
VGAPRASQKSFALTFALTVSSAPASVVQSPPLRSVHLCGSPSVSVFVPAPVSAPPLRCPCSSARRSLRLPFAVRVHLRAGLCASPSLSVFIRAPVSALPLRCPCSSARRSLRFPSGVRVRPCSSVFVRVPVWRSCLPTLRQQRAVPRARDDAVVGVGNRMHSSVAPAGRSDGPRPV